MKARTGAVVIEIKQVVAYPVAITPDGKTAHVTNRNSDSMTPIDTTTNTAGPAITVGSGPRGVAITPDQPRVTLHAVRRGADRPSAAHPAQARVRGRDRAW